MDSVDLYQVHNRIGGLASTFPNALTPDDMLRSGGIADAMQSLVDKGLTRHIGFTSTGEVDTLHEVIASQTFEAAQIYYNPLNPSAGRDIKANWCLRSQEHHRVSDVGIVYLFRPPRELFWELVGSW